MDFWIPVIAHAEATVGVKLLIFRISDYILNPLIKVGFAVAVLYFMWGVIEYIRDRDAGRIWDSSAFDKEGKMTSRGADKIVYGLFGLFIMASAFGIMNFIANLVGSNVKM